MNVSPKERYASRPVRLGSRTSTPSRIVYDIQWGSTSHTAAPAHLLMKGLILDSSNTVLLERPSPSPALNSRIVYGISSVMYITVRWE